MSKSAFSTLLATAGLLAACGHSTPPCQLHARYRHVTDDIGSADLSFNPTSPGHFIARESGLKNFVGMATFSEGVLRIVFQTADGYSGTYTWELDPTCANGQGRLDVQSGGSGTHHSTLSAIE
jgi:hypothetical protein